MTQKDLEEEQENNILIQMIDDNSHTRYSLEKKGKGDRKGIAHSTIIKRWKKLLVEGSIVQVRSIKNTKKGENMNSGKISFMGLKKLILFDKSTDGELKNIISKFLPDKNNDISQLTNYFKIDDIRKNFKTICENIQIDFHKDAKKLQYPLQSSLKVKKWVSLYKLNITINIGIGKYVISKYIFISNDDDYDGTIVTELEKIKSELTDIFIGFFLYELRKNNIKSNSIQSLFKTNKILKKISDNFMLMIKNESKKMNDTTKSICNEIDNAMQ